MYVSTLLLATFVLQANAQGGCSDYSVQANQSDFLEGEDVKLKCTHTYGQDITTIIWRTQNNTNDPDVQAYIYVEGKPDFQRPGSGFEGRLEGKMDGKTHTLTILKANSSDGLNHWTCIVNVQTCPNPKEDFTGLILTEASFKGVKSVVNGEVVSNGETITSKENVNIRCFALSDPASQVRIEGLATNSPQTCERVSGDPPQPWNCSITAVISKEDKGEKSVNCTANFKSTDFETGVFKIIIEGGLPAWIIAVIIIIIIIVLFICTICWINGCCVDIFCCPDTCINSSCIPQMCSKMECCPGPCKEKNWCRYMCQGKPGCCCIEVICQPENSNNLQVSNDAGKQEVDALRGSKTSKSRISLSSL